MQKMLSNLLLLSTFIPHGHCYLWNPELVWLHVTSDALIALAYYSIPITLLFLIRKRQDLHFSWMFALFSVFIIACGITHLMDIWTLWYPNYWISGWIKAMTAGLSGYAAIQLIPLTSQALTLPSPEQLELQVQERTAELVAANAALQSEISDRKRTEALLQESENRLQAILNSSTAIIYVIDSQGRHILANPAYEALLETSSEKLIGHHLDEFWPPEIAEQFQANNQTVLATGDPIQFEETILVGEQLHTYISFKVPLLDASGKPYAICGISTDISDRKQAETELQQYRQHLEQLVKDRTLELIEANERLQQEVLERQQAQAAQNRLITILEATPDFVGMSDAVGYTTYINRAGRQMLGIAENEDVSTTHISSYCAPSAIDLMMNKGVSAAVQSGVWRGETALQHHQGWEIPVSQVIMAHKSEAGTVEYLSTIARDITEVKQREAERKQTEVILRQQADREKLMNAIAQRIRQSLNLETILSTTVAEVRQCLQADRALIYCLCNGTGRAVTEAVAPGWPTIVNQTFPEEVFPVEVYRHYCQGCTLAIADLAQALDQAEVPAPLIEFAIQFEAKAKLAVPIFQEQTLWGLLVVHQCQAPRQWQSWELDLLKQLATQVGIALQQSELYSQVQSLNANLEHQVQERTAQLQQSVNFAAALQRITDKVRDSLDEQQILQTAVQELTHILRAAYTYAALLNAERTVATISYEHSSSDLGSALEQVIPMSEIPLLQTQLLRGKPDQGDAGSLANPHLAEPLQARLLVPIVDNQGVIGFLGVFYRTRYVFNDMEVQLVQQVANQCAIAIRQARLYQTAQAQVKELESLNHLKDDFLSTVSHELRTPVTNMKMATQMLELVLRQQGVLDKEPSRVAQYFKILNHECQREISLINDLLDLSRLTAGTESLVLATVDLPLWIASIVEPFIARTRNQQQDLQVDIPKDLPVLITDLSTLGRILTELLNNACKYTPSGEAIVISIRAIPEALLLSVSNSGVELPPEELERIFEKFYRIPNNDPWKHGGTGLGLALVKKRIEHLGAKIQAESRPGKLVFTIQLPLNPKP